MIINFAVLLIFYISIKFCELKCNKDLNLWVFNFMNFLLSQEHKIKDPQS